MIPKLDTTPVKRTKWKAKPKFNENDLGKNPFEERFIIHVREIVFKNQYTRDADGILNPVTLELEKEPMTKVYSSPILRKIIMGLPNKAKEMFLFLMYDCDYGKDYIWINRERYMEETGITASNTVVSSLKILHAQNIIIPTIYKDVYWLNPAYFFKGDRVSKYPNNIQLSKTDN